MNRRSFFRSTLGALAAAAVAPYLPKPAAPVWHVGRSPWVPGFEPVAIPMRKMMARIIITEEAMQDLDPTSAFKLAWEEEIRSFVGDIQKREEAALFNDGASVDARQRIGASTKQEPDTFADDDWDDEDY